MAADAAASSSASNVLPSGHDALLSLEAATGKGDAHKICNLLSNLKQQFSEQNRKTWPADTVQRLWASVLSAMKLSTSPEVRSSHGQACSLQAGGQRGERAFCLEVHCRGKITRAYFLRECRS